MPGSCTGSKHTDGHVECPACSGAILNDNVVLLPGLLFGEAFEVWISHRVLRSFGQTTDAYYLSERTEWDYRQYARALEKFFGKLRLCDIHIGHLREYQRARAFCDKDAGQWQKQAGANRIRKEVSMLERIMKDAGAWNDDLARGFRKVKPVHNDVPRAMSPEEQHRFLHVASSNADWQFIYWYTTLALQTTASTDELRNLHIGDIVPHQGVIMIRSGKNKYRIRTIPIGSPELSWSIERLIERAKELGASGPHHYLFPIQAARNSYDPTRPMSDSGLKKRWHEVRVAADLAWLRPYDLRHTAITRMAEAGVPIQVIMSFAGHMTMRMQLHYTSISMSAKRKVAASTWSHKTEGVGTYVQSYTHLKNIS